MSTRRLDQAGLLRLIDLAYAAAEAPGLWQRFLLLLTESVGAKSAHLLHHDYKGSGAVNTHTRLDPDAIRLYNEHFHRVDLLATSAHARAMTPGACATDEMFVDRGVLICSEYFNDFSLRFDNTRLMSTILDKSTAGGSAITLLRGRRDRPFDAGDMQLLGAVSPHIRRSLQIHARINGLAHERALAVEALDVLHSAVFFVDKEAKVVLTNRRGDGMLAARDGLSTEQGRLCAASPADTKRLRDMCAAVVATRFAGDRHPGGALRLEDRPSGRPPLHVLVAPAPSTAPLGLADARVGALVFVSDPADNKAPDQALLRQLYGLTPAESDVAAQLTVGRSLEEIAAARGSAIETVRRQNKQILSKTGARHRTDLVRKLSTVRSARHVDGK